MFGRTGSLQQLPSAFPHLKLSSDHTRYKVLSWHTSTSSKNLQSLARKREVDQYRMATKQTADEHGSRTSPE